MSYHPGISIAKFLDIHKPVFLVSMGAQLVLPTVSPQETAAGTACDYARTTVMGMFGAFGKMKATSGNLPRRLKFSAMGILRQLVEVFWGASDFFIPSCATTINQSKLKVASAPVLTCPPNHEPKSLLQYASLRQAQQMAPPFL